MMGLAGLLGTVELKSIWSVCLWLFVPPELYVMNAVSYTHLTLPTKA